MKAPLPHDEEERLEALRRYRVLDTPPEQLFDDLASLAAFICQTPIALITLLDEKRQWFKSKIGVSQTGTSRDNAFCAHAILQPDEMLEVQDAERDPRFMDNLFVISDPRIRFYAGAPLVSPSGQGLGTICVMDRSPRALKSEQLAMLRALGRQVVSQLELRRQSIELADEAARRLRAETQLRQQFEQLSASKEDAERLLAMAGKSRRALLSVLEDERRAGQSLRESEQRFRLLAENIDEVFWITDPTKERIHYVSPAYEKIWGRACAEVYTSPKSWLDAIHPEDRERILERAVSTQSKGVYDEEFRIIRPDGSVRWIRDRAFPVLNASGEVESIVGVARDHTERKEAEDVLQASERRFREMLENVEMIAMTLDTAGTVTFCNDHLLRLANWRREDVIGADWFEKFIPEEDKAVRKLFHETISTGMVPPHFENPIKTRAGELRDIVWNNTMLRDSNGNITGIASLGEDVTEQKRTEARVREQAELLDLAHDAISVWDFHSRKIRFWNQESERLYGWTAEEARGRDAGELTFRDPDALEPIAAQLLKTGEWRSEQRHVSKSGGELIVSGRATLVRDAEGNPKSVLVINIDITQQKKLEQQFLRAQRVESIGTLAGGVAHDLNNILAPIMMSVPALRGELPESLREKILSTIETCARRGADIVKQVLTFARGVEGDRVLVKPIHLIKEMAEIAKGTFPKGISIKLRYPENMWAVKGDPTQLHQVLLNLCVNARDAMPDGGNLTISLENFTVDEQYAGMTPLAKAGPYVVINVSDTGAGIPPEIIDNIFDPFFTTKELENGTGLGLSTVIGIVKSHGGFVTVESVVGRGTTFKVFLPAIESEEAEGDTASPAAMPVGHGELILLVDDEDSILLVTKTMLERYGYRVITAPDSTDALALFARQMKEVRVVIADMMMPSMPGLVLLRVLNRMNPDTALIACSGQHDDVREAELKELGVKVLLRKPYNTARLLAALRSVLDGKPATAS